MPRHDDDYMPPRDDDYMPPHDDDYMAPHDDDYMPPHDDGYMAPHDDDYIAPHDDDYMAPPVPTLMCLVYLPYLCPKRNSFPFLVTLATSSKAVDWRSKKPEDIEHQRKMVALLKAKGAEGPCTLCVDSLDEVPWEGFRTSRSWRLVAVVQEPPGSMLVVVSCLGASRSLVAGATRDAWLLSVCPHHARSTRCHPAT